MPSEILTATEVEAMVQEFSGQCIINPQYHDCSVCALKRLAALHLALLREWDDWKAMHMKSIASVDK